MEQCFKQKSSFRTIRIILFSLSMLFAYATNGYAQNMVRGVVTDVTVIRCQESASLSKVRPQVPLPILTVDTLSMHPTLPLLNSHTSV